MYPWLIRARDEISRGIVTECTRRSTRTQFVVNTTGKFRGELARHVTNVCKTSRFSCASTINANILFSKRQYIYVSSNKENDAKVSNEWLRKHGRNKCGRGKSSIVIGANNRRWYVYRGEQV